jgi:hypothetical protein
VGTALLATLCAASVAIISVKILEKLPIFQLEKLPVPQQSMAHPDAAAESPNDQSLPDESGLIQPAHVPMPIWGTLSLLVLGVFFAVLFIRIMAPNVFGLDMPADSSPNGFVRAVNALSILAIPFLLSFFPLYAAARGVKVYDEFVEGAKEAFNVILKIIPFLVTMPVGIKRTRHAILAGLLADLTGVIASVVICRAVL